MSKTRIGDTVVAEGGSVKWGLLFSTIFGSAAYAVFEGSITMLLTWWHGVESAIVGVTDWLVMLIDLEVTTAVVAARSSWRSFGNAVEPTGVLAWFVSVLGVAVVFLLLFIVTRRVVSARV